MTPPYRCHLSLSRTILVAALFSFISLVVPHASSAGVWQVSPIRLDFDSKTRSGVITVRNDGEEKLVVTVDAKEWNQSQDGKDSYGPTSDLLFFPKQLTVLPKEERILRVGTKSPAATKEKTFRLFIKEEPQKRAAEGAVVNIAMQFAVPVFVKPPRAVSKGVILGMKLENGEAEVRVGNEGNSHLRVNTVGFIGKNGKGETLFNREVNGWYLLNGMSRRYSTPVPEDQCNQVRVLEVSVISDDRTVLSDKINVGNNGCRSNK